MFLAYQSPQMSAILMSLLLGLVIAYDMLFRHRLNAYGQNANMGARQVTQSIQEAMHGFKEIRILGVEQLFFQDMRSGAETYSSNLAKQPDGFDHFSDATTSTSSLSTNYVTAAAIYGSDPTATFSITDTNAVLTNGTNQGNNATNALDAATSVTLATGETITAAEVSALNTSGPPLTFDLNQS